MRDRTNFYLVGLTLLSVFLLWAGWEFVFEDIIGPLFWSDYDEESLHHRWEYVISATILTGIALIVPTLVSLRSIAERKRGEELLKIAVESMPEGFAYFDPDDRLAMVNSKIVDTYPMIPDVLVPGVSYETIVRTGVERGQFCPDAGQDKEEWIEKRLAYHRDPKGTVEFNLPDGRCIRVEEVRTPEGGIVGVRTDITDLKKVERQLREARDGFELRVRERTTDLAEEVAMRARAEEAVRESGERHRRSYNNTPAMLHSIDKDGRLLSVSDHWLEVLGYGRDEVIGDQVTDFMTDDSARYLTGDVRPVFMKTGRITDFPFQFVKKNGQVIDVLVSAVVERDEGGEFVRSLTVLTDVTERKRAEERFRHYFDLPLVGSGIYAPDKRWIEVNDKLCDLFGYTRDELMALTWVDITHPDDIAENLRLFDRALSGQGDDAYTMDKRFVRKDGETIHTSISTQCVRRPDGAPDYFIVLVQDLTERKRAEAALRESEERFRAFIHHAPTTISFKDIEGRYLLTNRKHEWLIGMTSGKVRGKTPHDIRGAEEADAIMAHHRDVVKAGRAIQREETHTRDGKVHNLLTVKFPIPDAAGNPAAIGSISIDITERKRAEEALRASEERFRTIAENVPGKVYRRILHPDGRVTWAYLSPGLRDLMELDPDEVIAKPELLTRTLHEDDRAKWDETVRKSVETLEPYVLEYRRITPSGKVKWMRTMARPHRRENGAVVWDGVTLDITEEKAAQAQLIQASKLATLGEMASGIAHEINQPLSVIGMSAELSLMSMEEGEFDTEFVRRKLETIVGQRDRMAEIIDHMRLFSRTDDAKLESFNPVDSVAGAIGLIEQQFRAAGIDLEMDCPADCRNVSGYPSQLEQVVLNLLTNARDAVLTTMDPAGSGNGNPAPRVLVSLVDDKRRKTVVISVADNGGGIPEAALERIFDPFFTTKTEGQGTGLGLSIGYSIIDAMGGRLEAQNTEGGAVFRISLPVPANGAGAVDRGKGKKRKTRTKLPRTKLPRARLPRVLVVDDEEAIVEEMAEYLGRKGYDVATAGNAREALDLQKTRPADVVVTDLFMPGMSGAELIRRLHKTDPDLPIVVLTGHTTFGDDREIVAEGASVVLKKPIMLRKLTESLKGLGRR